MGSWARRKEHLASWVFSTTQRRFSTTAAVMSVPLPHGTEVITRVDRVAGERRIPQGSVGRVTKTEGDHLEVTVVGVGVLRYARDEVSPRRVGQALFAHRRADAWGALRPCVVLESTVGSHAWGLADKDSDVNRRGVGPLHSGGCPGSPRRRATSARSRGTSWRAWAMKSWSAVVAPVK